jgi:uncharacterized membrane protein
MPPAIFLFLTGITFAFLMNSQERKPLTSWQRIWSALKRARYLFLIAFLFRIQLYVFGFPTSPADQLLKVDILNCMGLAMVIFAPMAVFSTLERIRLSIVLGCVVAGLAPVVSMIDPNAVPGIVRSYFFPSTTQFGFFPWAAFLAFGMAAGSILRVTKHEDLSKVVLWFLGVGVILVTLAKEFSGLPYSIYSKSDFWLNSPALIFIKTGVVLCALAIAYAWVHSTSLEKWSIFRQLGTTSLLVYWVHIELVYGRWFGIWKEALSVPQVLTFTAVLIAAMTGLSILQTRWPSVIAYFRPAMVPQRASGD